MSDVFENPFSILSPESIPAKAMHELFVDDFTDFEKLRPIGHVFIHGPRGCGKSMMFRYMQPDSQCEFTARKVHQLEYLGAYVSIKNMGINRVELNRLAAHSLEYFFNEHILTVYIAEKVFEYLSSDKIDFAEELSCPTIINKYYCETCLRVLKTAGARLADRPVPTTGKELFKALHEIFQGLNSDINTYIKALAFGRSQADFYDGPLCGYHDTLFPILKEAVGSLRFLPSGPVYLMLDDADNLNLAQTKILNTWVFSRTHQHISLKVSTQMKYKTYRTMSGESIETPHDYSEINIVTLYTSNKRKYADRLRKIVDKRMAKAEIPGGPDSFFPEDPSQVSSIEAEAKGLLERWNNDEGRGNRSRDDVARYARPNYIRSLGGLRKSTSKYSYSGFEQLSHLSSGIVRHFLEPASKMYSSQMSQAHQGSSGKHHSGPISYIDPSIQNDVMRDEARDLMVKRIDQLRTDPECTPEELNKLEKLNNLLQSMGATFQMLLDSDRSERRVFSIAFSDSPTLDVLEVLRLGVEENFLFQSTIGNKEGNGRTRLYVMSRRLAPFFNLDPTSFAGYLFVTNENVRQAMTNPRAYLRELEKSGPDSLSAQVQLTLFSE